MTEQKPYRNPAALTAFLLALVPFITSLTMLGLQRGINPWGLFYLFSQLAGMLLLGLIVISSAFTVVALARTDGQRDWRIPAAFLLLVLTIANLAWFKASV